MDKKVKFEKPEIREVTDSELLEIAADEMSDTDLTAYAGDGDRGGY